MNRLEHCEKERIDLFKRYEKLVEFLKQEVAMRNYACTTNHAVMMDNARELLKEIGEL